MSHRCALCRASNNPFVMRYHTSKLFLALAPLFVLAMRVDAQVKSSSDTTSKTSDLERKVQAERRGGGLRVGQWHVDGQQFPTGATVSTIPNFEGYYRTGLDLHLVFENSVGLWRQRQANTSGGGLLGGSSATAADDYIIPQYTSIVFYPLTTPNERVEPFIRGGLGFAIGVDDPQNGGGGISFTPGFGATGGLGLEWRATEALGLSISGRYQ